MPAPSPEEQLPFLLDEDPSRGSSKHSNMNSQAGSSVNAQMGPPQQQQYQQQQVVQPSLQQQEQERQGLAQQRRAWSIDPQQALQVGSLQVFLVPVHPQQKLGDRWESGHIQCIPSAWV